MHWPNDSGRRILTKKVCLLAAIYYDLGIYWWHLPFSEAKVHATSMYASSSQNPVFVCFRALMSIDQEEQKDNQFFVTTKFFKTGQMTICLQNLLFQNRELRAGADVFWAALSKNLIPRYSDKHYLKKHDEEEKKMSSHSSSHGFHCNLKKSVCHCILKSQKTCEKCYMCKVTNNCWMWD